MKTNLIILTISLLLTFCSCNNSTNQNSSSDNTHNDSTRIHSANRNLSITVPAGFLQAVAGSMDSATLITLTMGVDTQGKTTMSATNSMINCFITDTSAASPLPPPCCPPRYPCLDSIP